MTDSTHAAIQGARVTARGKTVDVEIETETTAAGEYVFPFLPPGDYEIQFRHDGFAPGFEQATLNVTERIAVNGTLNPAAVTTREEVTANTEMLQTETATLGGVVAGHAMTELPLSTPTSRNCFRSFPARPRP